MKLLIVAPLFKPAQGGASTYYDLLVSGLLDRGTVEHVTIITSKVPEAPSSEFFYNGRVHVHRLFPYLAGAARQPWLQYPKYAFQNLQYLRIPGLVRENRIDHVLVHSSFHNYPNLIRFIAGRGTGISWTADVRDHLMPVSSLSQLEPYDNIVACSRNVLQHVSQRPSLRSKIEHIPVIQEELPQPSKTEIKQFRADRGVASHPYLSYVGLIKPEKGVDLLLDAFEILASRQSELHLVLVGQMKDAGDCRARIQADSRIHYLGEIPRREVLTLMKGAKLNVNLSPIEGLPRSSLEALELGEQVALPPNIPEFEEYCPEHVVRKRDPQAVASKLRALLCNDKTPDYPVERHRLDFIIPRYKDIFISN